VTSHWHLISRDVRCRSSLRSSSSSHLVVPPVCRSNVGARAFPVVGPALWNSLPADITSIDSQFFVIVLKIICFLIRIRALFSLHYFLPWPRSFLYCTWSRKSHRKLLLLIISGWPANYLVNHIWQRTLGVRECTRKLSNSNSVQHSVLASGKTWLT